MVRSKTSIVVVLILALGILAIWRLFPDEEKKVRKQFDHLGEYASKAGNENPLATASKIQKFVSLFTDPCEVKVPFYALAGKYNHQEIGAYTAGARSRYSELSFRFDDFAVLFPEKELAEVKVTGRLTGKQISGERVDETRELQCLFKKLEGQWLFYRFEIVEVLKK